MDWVFRAITMAAAMGWEILWPLILGFTLSAVVQAVVSHREMSRLLPDDRPGSIVSALALGAASSSCSYAAVALARSLFRHPTLAQFWGPIVGPLVAVIAFVCSVGNIPLAAVLWNGGISFGGVVAFIFADLIVLPVLNIYRKYYGLKMAIFLFATFYISMAAAALVVEGIFSAVGLIPREHKAKVIEASISWNYTTWLNIVFLALAGLLLWRFLETGGPHMLRMMNKSPEPRHAHVRGGAVR